MRQEGWSPRFGNPGPTLPPGSPHLRRRPRIATPPRSNLSRVMSRVSFNSYLEKACVDPLHRPPRVPHVSSTRCRSDVLRELTLAGRSKRGVARCLSTLRKGSSHDSSFVSSFELFANNEEASAGGAGSRCMYLPFIRIPASRTRAELDLYTPSPKELLEHSVQFARWNPGRDMRAGRLPEARRTRRRAPPHLHPPTQHSPATPHPDAPPLPQQ